MFKSFLNTVKNLGKKAIGYVRGLNGNKAAALVSSLASKYLPFVGDAANPFLQKIGNYINEKLEDWSDFNKQAKIGGVKKPNNRWRIRQKDNMTNDIPLNNSAILETENNFKS